MKRVLAYLIGFGFVFAAIFANAAAWNGEWFGMDIGGGAEASEPSTITNYVADFVVDEDGDIHVTETLTIDGLFTRHGIFRFLDRADPTAPSTRRTPYDVSVTLDGDEEFYEELKEEHRRITNLKIGKATETLGMGEHTYVIKYSMHDALQPADGVEGDSQFYWQLIPSGWLQDIEKSTLTVHLPAPSSDEVLCAIGLGDAGIGDCEATGAGTDTLTVTTGELADHEPVSIKTGLDLPTPDQDKNVPWSARLDRTLSSSPILLGIVLLMGLAAAVIGVVAARSSYERNPQFPLMYAPPDGVGPAQAKYIFTESIDQEAYVATLMYAAEQGAIDLQKNSRRLDDHRQAGRPGLGRPRRGHGRRRPPAGRARHHVRGRTQGRVGRSAAEDRDRVVRHQRQGLGAQVGQPGQLRARRRRRPARRSPP